MDNADAFICDLIPFLGNVAQMLDEMKTERGLVNGRGLAWTDHNQEQRSMLTIFLRRAHALSEK